MPKLVHTLLISCFCLLSLLQCFSQTATSLRLELKRLELENKYGWVGKFDPGTVIATFYDRQKMGYIDTLGRQILPLGKYATGDFKNGNSIYFDIDQKVFKVMDKVGKVIRQYSGLGHLESFDNGVAVVMDTANRFGVMRVNGTFVIKCQYTHLERISSQYYRASDFQKGSGILDANGNIIIPLEYIFKDIDTTTLDFTGYRHDIGYALFNKMGNVRKFIGKEIYPDNAHIEGRPYFQRDGVIILKDRFNSTYARYGLVDHNFDTIVPFWQVS